jgi:hypothetical protein
MLKQMNGLDNCGGGSGGTKKSINAAGLFCGLILRNTFQKRRRFL